MLHLVDGVINTLMSLFRWVFILGVFKAKKHFGRYNAENYNFPALLKFRENMRVKKEITQL